MKNLTYGYFISKIFWEKIEKKKKTINWQIIQGNMIKIKISSKTRKINKWTTMQK